MKWQIFDELVEYFSGIGKIFQGIIVLKIVLFDCKCEVIFVIGLNKGLKCLNKVKDNIFFCGWYKRIIVVDKDGVV